MAKKSSSSTHYRYEDGSDFDHEADFSQLLEDARRSKVTDASDLQAPGKEEKQSKKSWRSSLLSWLNTDKKYKSTKQTGNTTSKGYNNPRREHVTVQRRSVGARKAASGPLIIGLFSSSKRVDDNEMRYVCLSQFSSSQKLHSYGPVYLVT